MRRAGPRTGIVLALALTACREERRLPDGAMWHLDATRATDKLRSFDPRAHEFVEVMLPEAAHGIVDHTPEPDVPTFWVNVVRTGVLQFKGNSYDLNASEPLLGARALEEWLSFMRELTAGPRWRHPDGTSRVPLLLHIDRDARWRHVTRAAPAWTDPQLRFAALDVRTWRHGPASLRFRPFPPGPQGTGTLPIRLERIGPDPGDRDAFIRVGIGDAVVDVPAPQRFDDPLVLEASNAAWDRARTALGEVATPESVAWVSATDDVPFGHVVAVLDLLVGAGIRSVELPEAQVRLVVDRTNARLDAIQARPWDQTVSTLGVAAVFAAGGLLAFFATRRPRRRQPRRRSRPS